MQYIYVPVRYIIQTTVFKILSAKLNAAVSQYAPFDCTDQLANKNDRGDLITIEFIFKNRHLIFMLLCKQIFES